MQKMWGEIMKKLIVLLVILFAVPAWGAPFLVSDPQAGITSYQFTGDAFFTALSPVAAQADGSLRLDVAGVPTGMHNVSVAACHPLWGCVAGPFDFTRPVVNAPAGLRLQAN